MNHEGMFEEIDSLMECVDGDTPKERFLNAFSIYLRENLPEESVYIIDSVKYQSVVKMIAGIFRAVKQRCEDAGMPLPTIRFDESTFVLSEAMVVFGYKQDTLNRLPKEHLLEVFGNVADDANVGLWIGNQSDIVLNIMIKDVLKDLS